VLKFYVGTIVALIVAILGVWAAWLKRKEGRSVPLTVVPPSNRRPRILIIDDNPGDLEECRLTLNGDYEVHTYRWPFRALADIALECHRGDAYDLIILDYMMEPLSGKDIAEDIKGWQKGLARRSRIVFFTRMGKMIDKPPGIAAVWPKPEDSLRLHEKVRELLNG